MSELDADADAFLQRVPVDGEAVRREIINAAKGEPDGDPAAERGVLPFCLDISAQTYVKIAAGGRTPAPEDFGGTETDVIAPFLRYRSTEEQETLKLLSGPRGFDRILFADLVRHFGTHYPLTAFADFTGFSFVEPGADGRYRLHALMRDHLYAELDADTQAELERFLVEWHDARCQPAGPKDVRSGHEAALRQAVYHREVGDAEGALEWFWERQRVFYYAARHAAIEPLNRWAVELAETRLGPDHAKTAVALNNIEIGRASCRERV